MKETRQLPPALTIATIGAIVISLSLLTDHPNWSAVIRWISNNVISVTIFGATLLLAMLTAVAWYKSDRAGEVELKPPTIWWAVAAVVLVVAATWLSISWLLTEANKSTDPAATRVEAIKTGIGIGAGAGGVFALLLTVRRQWHSERSSIANERDAQEKRVTELYTRAVDQLGSDKAPVRLAGLYALERLAQSEREQRQVIVNVICAYLRMPQDARERTNRISLSPHRRILSSPTRDPIKYSPYRRLTSSLSLSDHNPGKEHEVRIVAQRILTTHLIPDKNRKRLGVSTFWDNIDLDLRQAVLIDLDLTDCTVRNANFEKTEFHGVTRLVGSHFYGETNFDQARFRETALFDDAFFEKATRFQEAIFLDDCWFTRCKFGQTLHLGDAVFHEVAGFSGAVFSGQAWFAGSRFQRAAWFREANFKGPAAFSRAQFASITEFNSSFFLSLAEFNSAQFKDQVTFDDTKFADTVSFDATTFFNVTDEEVARSLEEQ